MSETAKEVASRSGSPLGAQDIRKQLGLSQSAFAERLGVSLRTLQEWEQGRHQPSGPALALLRIADQEPDVFLRVR